MKSPHFTRLVTSLPIWQCTVHPTGSKQSACDGWLPDYPLGSARTFLLSTPYTTSLLSLNHHLPLTHLPPTSNQLRSPILPVLPLFHAGTCLERDGERSSLVFYLLVYHLYSFLVMALLSQDLLWRSENQTGFFLVVPERNIDASD